MKITAIEDGKEFNPDASEEKDSIKRPFGIDGKDEDAFSDYGKSEYVEEAVRLFNDFLKSINDDDKEESNKIGARITDLLFSWNEKYPDDVNLILSKNIFTSFLYPELIDSEELRKIIEEIKERGGYHPALILMLILLIQ